MPKPRRLSGRELIAVFRDLGFDEVSRAGSHVKLRRVLADGTRQTLVVPLPVFIESLCFKRFGRERPERVLPIEEWSRQAEQKRAAKPEAKRRARSVRGSSQS
ncbi:MAG: type II toxin-antitoxin system HicA family toxin [Chloroflexota bacterium]